MNAVMKQHPANVWREELVALLPRLRRYAVSLTGTVHDGEDLLHSTVERALARVDQFKQGTDLDRWLFRICKNLWLDEVRSRKVRGETSKPETPKDEPWVDGENQATAAIGLSELGAMLSKLQDDHREVLLLIVVEGYSYKEAAEQLELPIGTIMSRLARARSKLVELSAQAHEGNENVVPFGRERER